MTGFYIAMVVTLFLGVIFHEYGHMRVAKRFGIKVDKFCVGFGPMVWSKTGKDGTKYGVAPFPFGGYCMIDEKTLDKRPLYQYVAVLIAGVVNNTILGLAISFVGYCTLSLTFGQMPNFWNAIVSSFESLVSMFGQFWNILTTFLNLKEIASYGGVGTQISTISGNFSQFEYNSLQYTALGIITGGGLNFALTVCNILPIPALDGGQIVIKCFRSFMENVFHVYIPRKVADAINNFGFCFLLIYQGIICLCDIPAIQSMIINF